MSTASFDNIQPSAGGTARKAVRGIAAAWANLNGIGTTALRDSENVSSVVDNGTGDYTFNWTNDFANTNYSPSGLHGDGSSGTVCQSIAYANTSQFLVGSLRIACVFSSAAANGKNDGEFVTISSLGDLA